MSKLTVGQKISLNQHLTAWPDNITCFKNICDLVGNNDDSILIWEPFEYMEKNRLILSIMGLSETIDDMGTWLSEDN
jgi:hypothetical protein